jgi:hypothetical protein
MQDVMNRTDHIDLNDWFSQDYMQQQYAQSWLDLGTYKGEMVGVWYRATVKSLVWYSKPVFDQEGYEIPVTWDELLALSDQMVADGYTPWSIGIESSGATGWVFGWVKRDWQTKGGEVVKNKELWQQYFDLQKAADFEITFHKVKGHASVPANERADDIATSFADGDMLDLYNGPTDKYEVSLNPKPQYLKKSPLYLSLVGGEVRQHDSWPECQKWVAGKSAKFKKVRTIAERDDILNEWGVSFADVT